jgi:tRNA uridine 5-carboxymethylaminomethyl modification enzyme
MGECHLHLAAAWRDRSEVAVHLEIDAKYDVYLERQAADVQAFRRDENLILTDVDYQAVPGLSNEARQKLEKVRPRTIGQAGRISHDPGGAGDPGGLSRREARRSSASA